MTNVHLINHPLIQHKLTILRDKSTNSKIFREVAHELSKLLGYEAMRELNTELVQIETPIATTDSPKLTGRKLALIPILRAGLVMAEAIHDIVPNAKVGHIGIYRDHVTHLPIQYYSKLPENIDQHDVFLLDPMLGTGGTATTAIDILKQNGVHNIKFVCMIAVPEGINKIQETYPEIKIYTAAIDEKLNENAYMTPGLGDAGDRIFGTN